MLANGFEANAGLMCNLEEIRKKHIRKVIVTLPCYTFLTRISCIQVFIVSFYLLLTQMFAFSLIMMVNFGFYSLFEVN